MMLKSFTALGAASALGLGIWMFIPIEVETSKNLSALKGNPQSGAYLARISGCIACHTQENGVALAGGPDLPTKFGTFAAPNLTTSKAFGIGSWTIEQFSTAVREGISPEGKHYYPAFPYEFYRHFNDQDIANLWAAFQTVPAVEQQDPATDIGFPFNIREGLKLWNTLFSYDEKPPQKENDSVYNRGAYLVEGPAHCGACHTGRNFAGGLQVDQALQGSDDLPDSAVAPAIDRISLIANGWNIEDLAYTLKTGITAEGDALGGEMGEVINDGTRFMSNEDLTAMATYLLSEH